MYEITYDPIAFGDAGQRFNTLADVLVSLNSGIKPVADKVLKDGVPMDVVRNSYGQVGIQQHGEIKQLFLDMLNEVDDAYMRPGNCNLTRQPYEMLPQQWEAFVAVGSACYRVYPCYSAEQMATQCAYVDSFGREMRGDITYFMSAEMRNRFGFAHNGPLYGRGKESNSRHEVHVAYALAEGKEVPPEVIAWYQENPKKVESIGAWFQVLLDKPEYRGKMSAEKLQYLVNLLKWEKIELTNENAGSFIRLMAELPENCTLTQVDDFLYGKGVLQLSETKLVEVQTDLTQAYSPVALVLFERLGQSKKQDAISRAYEQREKYHHSLRELQRNLKLAEQIPAVEGLRYPNLMAEALDKRDIKVLLTYLDTSNDVNVVTKKVVQELLNLKVRGVKAEERRNAIFMFCGYDKVKRAEYEKEEAEQQAAIAHSRQIERAKKQADSVKVNFAGKILSGSEYVDRAVAEGFTQITKSKKGAAMQYWLSNLVTQQSRSLQKNNGTLDYAIAICGETAEVCSAV